MDVGRISLDSDGALSEVTLADDGDKEITELPRVEEELFSILHSQ